MQQKDTLSDRQGPVFIIASERSGTNLIRRRLSEFQHVAYGPPPLHFLNHLYYAQPFYGDLSCKKVLHRFLKDAIGLAYNHFSPWQVQLTVEDIINWHKTSWDRPITAVSVMHAMFTLYAWDKGYETYICKDNNLFDFCYPIATEIPTSKFIYLYRDPRDVVASQLNRPTQNKSIAKMALLWKDEQIKSIQAVKSPILSTHNVVSLSYENFVKNEKQYIEKICKTLNINFSNIHGNSNAYVDELADIDEWKNLDKPTNTDSLSRYKKQLDCSQVKLIESITWHQMNFLGYITESSQRPATKRIIIEKDKFVGTLKTLIARRLNKRKITKGQKKRQKYINELRSRIYL